MNASTTPLDPAVRVQTMALIDDFFGRVDRGESVAELLEEQAEFITPHRQASGREGVASMLLSLAQSRKDSGRVARHFGGNLQIERLGEHRYRVRCLAVVIAMDAGEQPRGFLNMGDHDDIVVVDGQGRYRFEKRSMQPVMQLGLTVPEGRL